eukprot:CAMPEP_0168443176 /NCGR_PEP_ID=MMETSP0228-20121227/44393_1 /TAXON_ID=133427 /ORGANISM="Protoceratium reticulatum, Strain CCCM 535 (=CCMP 1889)" /LENGTH=52 /DNA_ID=CAMNT_0008457569 /DNA_START=20 /DNA_END=175 /DNA_ORIENTATION=+
MADQDAAEVQRSPMASALWCCFFGAGIIGSLLIYGLLQERIMSEPYDSEFFT